MQHNPVMLREVIEALSPQDGETYIDGTFGAGGYSTAILEAADCTLYAIDRDPSAKAAAGKMSKKYGERFIFIQGRFGNVRALIPAKKVNGFVLDIGVSSMQIDQPERGFSFRFDGALDMRMDTANDTPTAADIVNTYEEQDLANMIYEYGEERLSRRIARKIVERRKEQKFTHTLDLADVIRSCVPRSKDKIDPATRTFQALRIAVNDELGELAQALEAAEHILEEGGRLVVVSFHSLEDRCVKVFLKKKSGGATGSRHMPATQEESPDVFKLISRKAIKASPEETAQNPRARSAKLRTAIRTGENHA